MNKYIDADKLIAEIERRIEETKSMKPPFDQFWAGQISAFKGVKTIIDSLQQEHDSISEQFAKIVRRNLTEISENAQKQFEQLYFKITNEKMYGGYKD